MHWPGTRLRRELPNSDRLIADRGYDADGSRDALNYKGIKRCIPGRKKRNTAVKYNKRRYKRRNRIKIMFGRRKDWRRITTRFDRYPKVFQPAEAIAATVLFWF